MIAIHTEQLDPLGPVTVAVTARGVCRISLRPEAEVRRELAARCPGQELRDDPHACAEVFRQLREYLAGARRRFELPLDAAGTPFQHEVWAALGRIPFGETWSYARLAAEVGRPRAARSVGQANGANPLCIVVPCHRVVAADGRLGGYAYGLEVKRRLLALENPESKIS